MSLRIGIVGLPNVGKSTLFQTITKKEIDRSNYPFCTIDPNIGVVAVPDERVDKLADLTHSVKRIYTTVEFVDIAGLVKGASKGEGLGNQFLANIREVDAIVYVLRGFKNDKIVNVHQTIDVLRDKEILDAEMALKDLATIEKKIDVLEKKVKANDKEAAFELEILKKIQAYLNLGEILSEQTFDEKEKRLLRDYQLLTLKPRLYLLNGKEEEINKEVIDVFEKNQYHYLIMDILNEFDGSDLSSEERKAFGILGESRINDLIKKTYYLLNIMTFLTTGPDETRAWTIKRGSSAPQAGGVIHSDFEKHFIKAEVIKFDKLLESEGFLNARKKGLIRIEGKDYIVQEGDVIEIKSDA